MGAKISTEPWIANLPCTVHGFTPTKSLSGVSNDTECVQQSKGSPTTRIDKQIEENGRSLEMTADFLTNRLCDLR
jgi:hypothetical protein